MADLPKMNKSDLAVWLSCHTQEEIAQAVGMSQRGVDKILEQTEDFRFVLKPGEFYEIEDEEERIGRIRESKFNSQRGSARRTTSSLPPWHQQAYIPPGANQISQYA